MDYILDYYKMGLFADADMALYVSLGWITQEQYDQARTDKAA